MWHKKNALWFSTCIFIWSILTSTKNISGFQLIVESGIADQMRLTELVMNDVSFSFLTQHLCRVPIFCYPYAFVNFLWYTYYICLSLNYKEKSPPHLTPPPFYFIFFLSVQVHPFISEFKFLLRALTPINENMRTKLLTSTFWIYR